MAHDSAVSITPWSLTQWCPWYHGAWLSGVHDTTELDSAVSMIPRSLTQRCPWYHGAWLSSVQETTELDSVVSMILPSATPLCDTAVTPQSYLQFFNNKIKKNCRNILKNLHYHHADDCIYSVTHLCKNIVTLLKNQQNRKFQYFCNQTSYRTKIWNM